MYGLQLAIFNLFMLFFCVEAVPIVAGGGFIQTSRSCKRSCLSDLLAVSKSILVFKQHSIGSFESLCTNHHNISLCVSQQEKQCLNSDEYLAVNRGLDQLCSLRYEELLRNQHCLSSQVPLAVNSCESVCGFSASLDEFSQTDAVSGTRFESFEAAERNVDEKLGPLCTSVGCMTGCLSRKLNENCAPSGTIIANAFLRPFVRLASLRLSLSTAHGTTPSFSHWPSSCQYLSEEDKLQNVINGVQHVTIDPVAEHFNQAVERINVFLAQKLGNQKTVIMPKHKEVNGVDVVSGLATDGRSVHQKLPIERDGLTTHAVFSQDVNSQRDTRRKPVVPVVVVSPTQSVRPTFATTAKQSSQHSSNKSKTGLIDSSAESVEVNDHEDYAEKMKQQRNDISHSTESLENQNYHESFSTSRQSQPSFRVSTLNVHSSLQHQPSANPSVV